MAGQEKDNIEFIISQYLDGQLSPRRQKEFSQQLEHDPALARELQKYQALDANLKKLDQAKLDQVDYQAQRSIIMERLERKVLLEGSRRRVFVLRPAFVGTMAAAAAVLLAVGLSWRTIFPVHSQPDSQVIVKVLPPADKSIQGEPVIRMSLPRLSPQEVAVGPRAESPDKLPSGTVMVSVMPPVRDSAEQAGQANFEYPM